MKCVDSMEWREGKILTSSELVEHAEQKINPIEGIVYIYGTFAVGLNNPLPKVNGQPQGGQVLTIIDAHPPYDGPMKPIVRFGLWDGGRCSSKQTQLAPYLYDGRLNYYGGYCRPNTLYDFKLKLDLLNNLMTVWYSGRGDDDWFLFAEEVPLWNWVKKIDMIITEQQGGAGGISDVHVKSEPFPEGEKIKPHPLAKKNRIVKLDAGFKFQSMRSLWRRPGRHVTIARDAGIWMGFPDVIRTKSGKMLVTYTEGMQHGGGPRIVMRDSFDLGRTWGPKRTLITGRMNTPRLQRLEDNKCLFVCDERPGTIYLQLSDDEGITWQMRGVLDGKAVGGGLPLIIPGHIVELKDHAWLCSGSLNIDISSSDRVEFYRSDDQGRTWKFLSAIDAYPPYSGCEPSMVPLPDGRLACFIRESRTDGMPGFMSFSDNDGKTWSPVEELPLQVVGRTCAALLKDGRVMLTTRVQLGRPSLWAWVEDPTKHVGFKISGVHFNDAYSKGLKDDVLYIDNDGVSGQFTQYFLRPLKGPESSIDLTFEVKAIENQGRAATFGIPFGGRLRIFPDYVELNGDTSLSVNIEPEQFHTYRVVSRGGRMKLYLDGILKVNTTKLDNRHAQIPWTPVIASPIVFSFGNEPYPEVYHPSLPGSSTVVYEPQITPEVTGLSLWKRVEVKVTDDDGKVHQTHWIAKKDGFPDQYQLDHILVIDASVFGTDQGYSGWTELPDGRIYCVNYTDDTAPDGISGIVHGRSWIRGTYILPSDLPLAPESEKESNLRTHSSE